MLVPFDAQKGTRQVGRREIKQDVIYLYNESGGEIITRCIGNRASA